MNLFKNELFSSTMLSEIQSHPPRSYRQSAFGQRYGRRSAASTPNAMRLTTLEPGAIEQIGDKYVLLDYHQAA